jgi:hypothetical protein
VDCEAVGRAKNEATEFAISGLFSAISWLPFNEPAGFGEDLARGEKSRMIGLMASGFGWTTRLVLAAEQSDGGRMGISWPEFTWWGLERAGVGRLGMAVSY